LLLGRLFCCGRHVFSLGFALREGFRLFDSDRKK
jgi:hypothetical protein